MALLAASLFALPASAQTVRCVGPNVGDIEYQQPPCPSGWRTVKPEPPNLKRRSTVKGPLAMACFEKQSRGACDELRQKHGWNETRFFDEEYAQKLDALYDQCLSTRDATICRDAACLRLIRNPKWDEVVDCAKFQDFPYTTTWAKVFHLDKGFTSVVGIACRRSTGEPERATVHHPRFGYSGSRIDKPYASRSESGKRFATFDEAVKEACSDVR